MSKISKSGAMVIMSSVLFVAACLVALGLRFWSIQRIKRSLKLHDYLCLFSFVFCTAYCIDISIGTVYGGIGVHITEVPLDQLTIALKSFFASQFFWACSITGFRLSILFVYIEIFTVGSFYIYAYGMVTIVSLFFVGSIATTLRLCQPTAFSWDKTIAGTCGDIGTAELAAAALNLSLDIIIVLLPLPLVWGLNMAKQRKIGLTVTFTLGLVISAINLGRIIQLKHCDVADFTYCTYAAVLLTIPEMAVGVIIACIPLLGPLLYPNRYKTPASSAYANLKDNSTKQKSALTTERGTMSSGLQSTGSFDDPATESVELSGLVGKNSSHKAWAKSMPADMRNTNTSTRGDWINIENEFRVTTSRTLHDVRADVRPN